MSNKRVVAIVGPTASGKSDLAVQIAKKFNGEIISADSRQVYRGLDIGTGKVPRDKLKIKNPYRAEPLGFRQKSKLWKRADAAYYYKGVRHHLLDISSPMRRFTVADFQKGARRAIEEIASRGKLPILCGGTGLYVDAALYDFPIPRVMPNAKLRRRLEMQSAEKLFEILKLKDPARARGIDRFNKRRLVRALEIVEATGKAVPPLDDYYAHPHYDILKIGIKISQKTLKEKIHKRLNERLRQGMIREVERLLKNKRITKKRLEELGLEYRYIGRYLNGGIAKSEMKIALEKEIERYAKRQRRWLRRDPYIRWIRVPQEAEAAIRRFLAHSRQ